MSIGKKARRIAAILSTEGLYGLAKRIKNSLYRKTFPRTHDAGIYRYCGYDIPIDLMLLTGGGPETFETISRGHIESLEKHIGIRPEGIVVEIGCGIGRDAIPLTTVLSGEGKYLGIDIIGKSIQWCAENISTRHPNFAFVHFDIKDQIHNDTGIRKTSDFVIPVESGTVDLIILQSVFTHLLRVDILHYLREFRRILKPSGSVYATMFVADDKILSRARATNLTPFHLRFEHKVDDGCYINDTEHPTGAVAYTAESVESMVSCSGLKLSGEIIRGAWSGYYPGAVEGQDVVILVPATVPAA